MNREAEVIVRAAFTLLKTCPGPENGKLVVALERLTMLGLDPLNTRVAIQAEAVKDVRREVLRRAAALMNAPRLGDYLPAHGEPEAASPAVPPCGGASLSVIEGGRTA